MNFALLVLFLLSADPPEKAKNPPSASSQQASTTDSSASGTLNLLGRTNTQSGESRRNENVQFNLVDNNAKKELGTRLGTTATVFQELSPSRSYFGGEYGTSPSTQIHLSPARSLRAIHGQLFWTHVNSIFTARSFFQVGGVKPSRENQYGVQASIPLWKGAWFGIDASQQKTRGQVNGNILVPRPEERTPLTADPAARALISSWIAAYPTALPNRTDIDPRALNTNAPQSIDTDNTSLRIDQIIGNKDSLVLRHTFTNQDIDAFQLVAGQNPDTTTKNHSARITWARSISARTTSEFSLGFDRVHSLLVPEPNAVGPQVQVGTAYTTLGPGSGIPIDRVQNRFRHAGQLRHQWNRYQIAMGGELTRLQFNGREASSNRGNYYFRNDFGRDAITNFRLGIPNRYSYGLGDLDRGFRNWEQHYFLSNNWQVHSRLSLNFGVRYQPQTGPFEVNQKTIIRYQCDCNNFSPHFGLAWRLPPRWGVFRASYGTQYGEIFPTTFQQLRWNPPEFLKLEVQNPDFLNPLEHADINPNGRAIVFALPENLKTPYVHLYNASWEFTTQNNIRLQFGYVGSRAHKLLLMQYLNRAQVVPGIPQITGTINDRRPDPRYFEYRPVINGARSYFDAARVSIVIPQWKRINLDASYWFSKAIDNGATYLNTAAGDDSRQGYSQSQQLVNQDLKGPSIFDQSHATLVRFSYETPSVSNHGRLLDAVIGRWTLSTITLGKSGIPFTVISGSDAPGFGNVDGTNGDRPNVVDPSILGRKVGNPDTSQQMLPRTAFEFIRPTDERGNLGIGTFRRGRIFNMNTAVSRTWSFRHERSLTFRAESVNMTNTPQFAEPNVDLTSPAFGKITNTLNDGRLFRLTLLARF